LTTTSGPQYEVWRGRREQKEARWERSAGRLIRDVLSTTPACPGYPLIEFPEADLLHPSTLLPASLDLHFAFGRVRLAKHELEVTVTAGVAVSVTSTGIIDDLYDFNCESPAPAADAAVVQLGYSSRQPAGKIFKDSVQFRRVWTTVPCTGW
jgi:hypothetical protein